MTGFLLYNIINIYMCVMWYILINTVVVIYPIALCIDKTSIFDYYNFNLINKRMPVSSCHLELFQVVRAFLFYDFEVLRWKKLKEI